MEDTKMDTVREGAAQPDEHVTPIEKVETPCPHCGMLASQAAVVPTDDEKRTFIEAVLTGGRFSKTYTVFGGKVEVELQDLSEIETADVHKAVMEYTSAKETETLVSRPTMLGVSSSYQLAHSLRRLVVNGEDLMAKHPKETETYLKLVKGELPHTAPSIARDRYWEILGELPAALVSTLVAKQLEFGALVLSLVRHASDPDFFSGIE